MATLGDTLRFRADLYDAPAEDGGALVNAITVTLTITLPDGTTATPTVTNPPATTGKYLHDYEVDPAGQTGTYRGAWLFDLASGVQTAYVQDFEVARLLVTVDAALAHLRARSLITSDVDREQVEWLCAVATDGVERDLGRVLVRRTITGEKHDGGRESICLHHTPVASVTSAVESGTTLSGGEGTDWVTDHEETGLVHRGGTSSPRCWQWGRRNIAVTYVAGYAPAPPVARKVALNVVERMWQVSQQAAHPVFDDSTINEIVGATVNAELTAVELAAYASLRASGIA